MTRSRATGGALLVALVLAASAYVRWRATRTPAAASVDAVLAPAPSARIAAHRYDAGHEATYAMTYASDGAVTAGGDVGAGASHLVSSVHARLVRTVMEPATREAHALVLFRFVDVQVMVSIDESPHAAEAARVESALARGFLAELAPSGAIVALRIEPSATPLARSFARTLAASTQVTLPAAPLSQWLAREVDARGPHAASYAVVGDAHTGDDRLAMKRTRGPLDAHAEQGDPLAALLRGEDVTMGVAEIDFDIARGEIVELASDETSDSSLGGRKVAHASSSFEAERVADRTLTAEELDLLTTSTAALRDAPPTPLDAHDPESGELAREEASRHWLGGATLAEIARGLDDEARRPRSGRAFDLFLKVQAYSYLHPGECAAVVRLLATRPPRGLAAQTIVAGLAATGSRNAQAALVSVVTARGASADAQLAIVPSLGMLSHPLPETEEAVRGLEIASPRTDVRETASLALGIMARSVAPTAAARAARIVDDALVRLAHAEGSEPAQILELRVLGNTGSPRILNDVVRLSHAASSTLRAQTAFALRFVPTAPAEARLLELLAADDDVLVRSRAASALSYRERTEASARVQRARAVDEPDAGVRAEIVHTLFAMRATDPEALAIVRDRRDRDPEESVRAVAAGFLAKAGIE